MQDLRHDKSRPLCGMEQNNAAGGSFTGLSSSTMPKTHSCQASVPSGQNSRSGVQINKPPGVSEDGTKASRSLFSAASVVLSSGGSCVEGGKVSVDSFTHCDLLLKEHDYIGLTEVSSASVHNQITSNESIRSGNLNLNLDETNLRLGLGPPDSLLSSGSGESKSSFGTRSLPGFHSSLSFISDDNSGNGIPVSAARQFWSSQEVKPASCAADLATRSAYTESGKELAWLDRLDKKQSLGLGMRNSQDLSSADWVKSEGQHEKQIISDARALQGMQSPSQYGIWSGQDLRFPRVDNTRPTYVSEVSALHNLWHANLFRDIDATRALPTQVTLCGEEYDAGRSAVLSAFAGGSAVPLPKNGVKRAYSEAMAAAGYNTGDNINGIYDVNAGPGAPGGAGIVKGILQLPELEAKHIPNQQSAALVYNWATVKPSGPSSWQFIPEQAGASHCSTSSVPSKFATVSNAHSEVTADSSVAAWEKNTKTQERRISSEKQIHTSQKSQHGMMESDRSNDTPPQKGQVVGWPPIRSFRKNTLAAHPKPVGDGEGESDAGVAAPGSVQNSLYVKVTMDGVPIGRKVDLNAHVSYEGLSVALEEMFQRINSGQGVSQATSGRESSFSCDTNSKQLRLLNGSDYVLTYEDKEGDWMLVGDVPWGMFVNAVRRLRIMKSSEATGLAPRVDKSKCRA